MPNGFHGSAEEWARITRPLRDTDRRIADFARARRIAVSENDRNWPSRSLRWSAGGIDKLIQIYLEDEKDLTYSFWICASSDREGKRFWKQQTLRKAVDISAIVSAIEPLLEEGYHSLQAWTADDLEEAAPISEMRIDKGILTSPDSPGLEARVLIGPRLLHALQRIGGCIKRLLKLE